MQVIKSVLWPKRETSADYLVAPVQSVLQVLSKNKQKCVTSVSYGMHQDSL